MKIIKLPDGWETLPGSPELAEGTVHLWLASLKQPTAYLQSLQRLLSPDEVQKAERFYFEKDKNAYIAGRGMLRKILAAFLNTAPEQITFRYNPYGKPMLANPANIDFNLSHSHELAFYAVSRGSVIGVDIEHIRPVNEFWEVARSYFSKNEIAMLETVAEARQLEAFYNCWTRKEAYIKAKGEGLSMPLHQFDVTLIPGEPARLLQTRGDEGEARRWHLESFTPQAGYVAAVAHILI